jgi:hypothetical protein
MRQFWAGILCLAGIYSLSGIPAAQGAGPPYATYQTPNGTTQAVTILCPGSGTAAANCAFGSGGTTAVTSTPSGTTTSATPNTFTTAAAANGSRKGCSVQNTGTGTLYVYFGTTGSTAASNQVAPGGAISCNAPGIVLTDAIQVADTLASQPYVLVLQ